MAGKLIFHGIMTFILLVLGGSLIIFAEQIREYCFKQYKASAERTGFFISLVNRYPSAFMFRIAGIVTLTIVVVLIIVFVRNIQT